MWADIAAKYRWFKNKHFSTTAAFIVWGSGAFTSQPTIASGIVHFLILPVGLWFCIWLAQREGRHSAQAGS